MRVTKFDRPTCNHLQARILAALRPLEAEYGIKFASHGGSFTGVEWVSKIRVNTVAEETGQVLTQEGRDWKYACYGDLVPSDLGRTVKYAGDYYVITGYRAKAQKYPILMRSTSGREVACAVQPVADALKKQYGDDREKAA